MRQGNSGTDSVVVCAGIAYVGVFNTCRKAQLLASRQFTSVPQRGPSRSTCSHDSVRSNIPK